MKIENLEERIEQFDKSGIEKPSLGWKAHTYYEVEATYFLGNVPHKYLLYVGELDHTENPGAFTAMIPFGGKKGHKLKDFYCVKIVKEIETIDVGPKKCTK